MKNQYEASGARSSAAYLAALGRLSTAIISEKDALHLLASSARELSGADFAAFIVRPVGKLSGPSVAPQLQIAAAVGLSPELEARLRRLPLEAEGPLAPLFHSGLTVRVSDEFAPLPGTEPLLSSDGQGTGEKAADQSLMRSCLGAPLFDLSGAVCGGVLLGHHEPGYFRQEDEAFLVSLAALARARFSAPAQVWQGTDEWTDQHSNEMQRELLAQTQQIKELFEAMTDAMFILDRGGNIAQTNTAARELFAFDVIPDYTRHPWEKRASLFTLLDPQGQPLPRERLPIVRLLQGEVLAGEQAMDVMIRILDGRHIQVSITGTPVRDQEGRLLGIVMIIRDLSERYHLERSLREAEQQAQQQVSQLETLFEVLAEALVVFDKEGNITRMNVAGQQLLERIHLSATAPFVDRSARVVVRDEQGQPLDRESFPTARILAGEVLTPPEAVEIAIGGEPGQVVQLSITGGPLRDAQGGISGAITLAHDVTERIHAEQVLQEQASLIDLAHDAIIVRDAQSRIVSWNQGAERLYGWMAWEVANRDIHTLLQTLFPALREEADRFLEQEGQWEGTLVHTTRAGHQVIVESRQVLVRAASGAPRAILEINRDITERQRLQQLEKRLHKEAERLKDEFIAIAAHELRNALTALKGSAQTLLVQDQRPQRSQLTPRQQREVLYEIDMAIARLVNLTEDLLDVTRLQAGRLELHLEPTNLIAFVRRMVKHMQRTTARHHLSLHTSLEALVLLLDPDRMEQVLSNLLENAIKYSPRGGSIEVTIWQESQESGREEVMLSVRDQGLGIPLQQQSYIFERFVRADNVRKIAGTGLGLYICRALVKLHSGRLWFSSVEGQGTTFFLALPGGEVVPHS